jgi:hypothetical protein
MKTNTEALLGASNGGDLEKNMEKTKYRFMCCHQTAGQNHYVKVRNKAFESMAKYKYFGMTATDWCYIYKEIKSRLNLGNACCHAFSDHLAWDRECR